jgi:AraC family transcriptional regulator
MPDDTVYVPNVIDLSDESQLHSLIESRKVYTLKNCELSIYETYQAAANIPLKFNDLVVTSMIRGKKIMHLNDDSTFDYLPGESLIWQANKWMTIDFPEATRKNPTQCVALTISNDEIQETLYFLNRKYPKIEESGDWNINMEEFLMLNSEEFTAAINKMLKVSIDSSSTMKDAFAELALRELLLKLMQTQARQFVEVHYKEMASYNRFAAVIQYIQQNIHQRIPVDDLCKKVYMSRPTFFRIFKREFGITPVEYIIKEKMKLARQILSQSDIAISDVSFQCGFNSVNHFIKTFRHFENSTPLQYKKMKHSASIHNFF